jgi:hypothetical protein
MRTLRRTNKRIPGLAVAITFIVVAASVFGGSGLRRSVNGSYRVKSSLIRHAATFHDVTPSQFSRLQNRADPDLSKVLKRYDVIKLDRRAAVSQLRRRGTLLLGTSIGKFDLEVVPNDLRSSDYRSQVIAPSGARDLPFAPVNTFKGRLKGVTGAQVRLTVTDNSLEGLIVTGTDRFFFQPARALSKGAAADELVFYNGNDVMNEGAACAVTLADQVAAESQRVKGVAFEQDPAATFASIAPAALLPGFNPPRVIRLATEADAEYVTALGGPSNANAHILSIMNQVDGIYQFELGLTFQVVFQNTWTDAGSDPYTTDVAADLLREFQNYWNGNFSATPRNLSHLWTGKHLSGGNGVAYLGVACRFTSLSYGLSQRFPDNPANPITAQTVVLAAHEIGHNFGAVHSDTDTTTLPADITQTCRGTIMTSSVVNGSIFCPFSRSQIAGFVNAWGSCLSNSSSSPPTYPSCADVPIDSSLSLNGTLDTADCLSPSRGLSYFADRYSFQGQAGERLNITMNQVSAGLNPQLYLIAPDGYVIGQESDVFLNHTARIPYSGSFTLPQHGNYIIEVTSFSPQETGSYTINLNRDGCVLSVNPSSRHFSPSSGGGTINVTATGSGCGTSYSFITWPNTASWLTTQSSASTGSQSLNFNVQANNNAAGRRAFLVVGASFGSIAGGISIPITQSGASPDCVLTPIGFGQTINATLSTSDCQSPFRGDSYFADRYAFSASAGQEVAISASASNRGMFLTLIGPNQRIILTDDGGGGLGHARIPAATGMLTLGLPGVYVVEVTGSGTGDYSLTLTTSTPQAPPVLLTEENTDVAAAVSSVSGLRAPFRLTDAYNFSSDGRTRVVLLITNVDLFSGENSSAVTAVAEDNLGNTLPLPVEFVGKLSSLDWLSQVVVKLPANLPTGQDVRVSISLHGLTSNKARLRIQ